MALSESHCSVNGLVHQLTSLNFFLQTTKTFKHDIAFCAASILLSKLQKKKSKLKFQIYSKQEVVQLVFD